MGLDMFFHGEKILSPKSKVERKLINELNNYPFTDNEIKELDDENDYLYVSDWHNAVLNTLVNARKYTGQIGEIKGIKRKINKSGKQHWTIITESWYLRKANAIHQWFIVHAQNGVDDCGTYPIDHVLDDFIAQANDVLNGVKTAQDTIPTQSGFFFGGTDYDEYYYHNLRETRQQFKRMVAKCRKNKWNYFYHSSW